MSALVQGRVVKLGDDVNTDNILPGRYLNLTTPAELGAHLLETYDPAVAARVRSGDVLVAGENFGMGSSREQAPIAMLARGVGAVVAAGFARIFLRNAVNLGLAIVECPAAAAALCDDDEIAIDLAGGVLHRGDDRFAFAPQPPFLAEIADAGGLVPWIRRRLDDTTTTPSG